MSGRCHGNARKAATSKSQKAGLLFPVGRLARVLKKRKYAERISASSQKAGLLFPVGRLARVLKKRKYAERISASVPVYLGAMMEYLAAEILELARNACHESKQSRMTARHLQLAIRSDKDFAELFDRLTIPSGGVLPGIHSALLPKNK